MSLAHFVPSHSAAHDYQYHMIGCRLFSLELRLVLAIITTRVTLKIIDQFFLFTSREFSVSSICNIFVIYYVIIVTHLSRKNFGMLCLNFI